MTANEANFAAELKMQMLARGRDRVESWDRQVRFHLIVTFGSGQTARVPSTPPISSFSTL